MVVLYSVFEEESGGDAREFPPRGDIPSGSLARKALGQYLRLHKNVFFLLGFHRDRVLMRIAMESYLVPRIGHHLRLLRESLHRVAGDEPGRLDPVFFEELQ